MRIHSIVLIAAVAALGSPTSAAAQETTHPAAPWVGCWEAVDGLSSGRTCIAPYEASPV